ncbi:MAG: HNH endonuclease signature motif containing protein [Candidatus Methanoperedens sp.]|nr:HNH endonuclease signature motif containing protein [Candidatus Methanoperedens sp.]MCZ7405779.1 HNH endonuclease signature motif containing protein [Candidatus Methanoperedens sp.]
MPTAEKKDKSDVDKIAFDLIERKLDLVSIRDYLKEQFENPMWKQLFNNNYEAFKKEVDLACDKILYPEKNKTGLISPDYEQKDPKDIQAIPPELRQKVLERDGYKCVMCGSTKYPQIDHIKPFSKGGDTVFENLQTMCRKCKLRKSMLKN